MVIGYILVTLALVQLALGLRFIFGYQRRQVFGSLAISGYFDIYKPLTNASRFGYVGSLCSSIWFGFTAYILLKK